MALETKDTSRAQQDPNVSGNQSGSTNTEPQQIPAELAALGVKDIGEAVSLIAEVGKLRDENERTRSTYNALVAELKSGQPHDDVDPLRDVSDDMFLTDPKKSSRLVADVAIEDHFNKRIQPLATQLIENGILTQKMALRAHPVFGDLLNDFEEELDGFLKTVPASTKAQPNAVVTALQFVAGKNIDKVIKKQREASARAGSAGAEGSGTSGSPAPAGKQPTLSDEERVVAEKQIRAGVFENMEDYLKWRDQ